MVESVELGQISNLYSEWNSLNDAIRAFDAGGRIVQFMVFSTTPAIMARVQSHTIEYPPQMVEGIKTVLNGRKDEIVSQLEKLGITWSPPAPSASPPAPSASPPARPPAPSARRKA